MAISVVTVSFRARTFDAILNGWGFPLNQDAHNLFVADMTQLLLKGFDQGRGFDICYLML
jgi:hypothetical protein